MKKIDRLKKEYKELQDKFFAKRRELEKETHGDYDFIQFETFYILDGKIEGHSLTFERGQSGSTPPPFQRFLYHASMIEMMNGGGGTYLDYLIEKYSTLFNITEDKKTMLMDEFWHNKKETIRDFVAQKFNEYFDSNDLH